MSEYDGIKMNICFDDELPLIDLKGRFSRIKHASIQPATVNDGSSGLLMTKPRQTGMCNSEFKNINWEGFNRSKSLITDLVPNEENPDED